MYANPFDRKFGIEFEFGCPGVTEQRGAYDRYSSRITEFEKILADNKLGDFRVGRDGTEWEIKSPILQGPTGFKRVKRFLDIVNDLRGYVTNSDGLHVHHDAPEFVNDRSAVVKLVESWINNQQHIYKMVDYNRYGNYACPQWTNMNLAELKQRGPNGGYFGRKNLNVSALERHGTIEIRVHEGTLDYEEILSWVRFGQAFIGKALDEYEPTLETADNAVELVKNVKVSRNASRFLYRKIGPVAQTAAPVVNWA